MNYAIVIGINHYQKRPLKGAVNDAKDFAKWLEESKQVKSEQLKLLVSDEQNEVASFHHVDLAFVEILNDANKHVEEKNRLYFYFSGHGVGVSYSNTGLCLRWWQNALPSYNISTSAYQDYLINKAVFDEIIVFLDCCRDYDFLIEPRPPTMDVTFVGSRMTGMLICYSTVYGKVSHEIQKEIEEDPDNKRGAFTSFLLEALRGDADNDGDGFISADDLLTHIERNFKSYALRYNKIQDADGIVNPRGKGIRICEVSNNTLSYNYIITFKRKTNISLFDGANNPIAAANAIDVDLEQQLKIQLPKGLVKIVDNNTKEEKYFTNYNSNTLTYEQF